MTLKPAPNRRPAQIRRGIAPLEFVMGLPVLLTLGVGMTWLGFSVIGQSEVAVQARHAAWKKRFDDQAKKPLVFTATPLYDSKKDFVSEKATKKVKVSPAFDRLPAPESTHLVLAGSWDHRAMPLDGPPSWKQYVPVIANAKTAGLQTSIGNIEGLAEDLATDAAGVLAEQINLGSKIENIGGDFENSGDAAEAETKAKREAERKRLQQEHQRLTAEIEATDAAINQLRLDYVKKLGEDATDDQKKQQELDRISRNIDLLKGKRERLRSQRRDVRAELNALS